MASSLEELNATLAVSAGGGAAVGTGLSNAQKPTVAFAFGESLRTSTLSGYGLPVAATYVVSARAGTAARLRTQGEVQPCFLS